MLENIISEWIRCINKYYEINRDGDYKYEVPIIDNQLKNDMEEFVEADKALLQGQANAYIMQSHPQTYYTSRKLTEILVQEESQGKNFTIEESTKINNINLDEEYKPLVEYLKYLKEYNYSVSFRN
ncbi:hypothetical protein RhiirB3_446473 [Rhizophagus irregularis]|nr:hypothetical protein RhiirB3_446473 [Rhizophagus irregularis]